MQQEPQELACLQFSAPVPAFVFDVIRHKPFENVILLKFLKNAPHSVKGYHVKNGTQNATMLVIDNRFNEFDRITYPTAASTILISSDSPTLTEQVLRHAPRNENLVFKLASQADRDHVARHFPLERRTAFISYTATEPFVTNTTVKISRASSDVPYALFAAQGHSQTWLGKMFDDGNAFSCSFEENGDILSACFAFEVDGPLWEIGGVYTRPDARRRQLAKQVVSAALQELKRSNRIPRYQVEDTNTPSILLAESLGMKVRFALTHYFSAIKTA